MISIFTLGRLLINAEPTSFNILYKKMKQKPVAKKWNKNILIQKFKNPKGFIYSIKKTYMQNGKYKSMSCGVFNAREILYLRDLLNSIKRGKIKAK